MDAGFPYKYPALAVNRREAERVLSRLLKEGRVDPARKVARGSEVLIPLRAAPDLDALAARFGGRLVDAPTRPREERRTPHEEALARLPPELRADAPDKWEKLGDVLVLRLPPALLAHARVVAAAYAEALACRCVVLDPSGVSGELREMQGQLLFGDDPVTTHLENGVRYRLDASRIMFSSGNLHERTRAGQLRAPGETLVDMFAGIGYFALPVAMRSGAARVVALEKNPLSFRFLQENARLNGVESVLEPWLGDNRDYPREGFADRVLMGYFPGTAAFLPKALRLLKPEGGVLHYHDTAHAERWRDEMERAIRGAVGPRAVEVQEARVVKSHSPGVVHAVLVARVGPRA